MSMSSDDDESSYASDNRSVVGHIGGIVDGPGDGGAYRSRFDTVREDSLPQAAAAASSGLVSASVPTERGGTSTHEEIARLFPPFFVPPSEVQLHCGRSSGSRRRVWGSSAPAVARHHEPADVATRATLFRIVVGVFHLTEGRRGAPSKRRHNREAHGKASGHSAQQGNTCPCVQDPVPLDRERDGVHVTELLSYLSFLLKQALVPVPSRLDGDISGGEDAYLSTFFLPDLDAALMHTVGDGRLVRASGGLNSNDLHFQLDVSACHAITIGTWKEFIGVPAHSTHDSSQISPLAKRLLKWWDFLGNRLVKVGSSDRTTLFDFLSAYCDAFDCAILNCTSRGMTAALAFIRALSIGSSEAKMLCKRGIMSLDMIRAVEGTKSLQQQMDDTDTIRLKNDAMCQTRKRKGAKFAKNSEWQGLKLSADEKKVCSPPNASACIDERNESEVLADNLMPSDDDDLFPSDDEDVQAPLNGRMQATRQFRRLKRLFVPESSTDEKAMNIGAAERDFVRRRHGNGTFAAEARSLSHCKHHDDVKCAWSQASSHYNMESSEEGHSEASS